MCFTGGRESILEVPVFKTSPERLRLDPGAKGGRGFSTLWCWGKRGERYGSTLEPNTSSPNSSTTSPGSSTAGADWRCPGANACWREEPRRDWREGEVGGVLVMTEALLGGEVRLTVLCRTETRRCSLSSASRGSLSFRCSMVLLMDAVLSEGERTGEP